MNRSTALAGSLPKLTHLADCPVCGEAAYHKEFNSTVRFSCRHLLFVIWEFVDYQTSDPVASVMNEEIDRLPVSTFELQSQLDDLLDYADGDPAELERILNEVNVPAMSAAFARHRLDWKDELVASARDLEGLSEPLSLILVKRLLSAARTKTSPCLYQSMGTLCATAYWARKPEAQLATFAELFNALTAAVDAVRAATRESGTADWDLLSC